MKTIFKNAATVALTGALALAAASPGEALMAAMQPRSGLA